MEMGENQQAQFVVTMHHHMGLLRQIETDFKELLDACYHFNTYLKKKDEAINLGTILDGINELVQEFTMYETIDEQLRLDRQSRTSLSFSWFC